MLCWSLVTRTCVQAIAGKDLSVEVNRVSWSPERDFIGKCCKTFFFFYFVVLLLVCNINLFFSGVAFSKHLIHLYVYQEPNVLQPRLEACWDQILIWFYYKVFVISDQCLCFITDWCSCWWRKWLGIFSSRQRAVLCNLWGW